MSSLPISASQKSVLDTIDTYLDEAFADGVDVVDGPHALDKMKYYKDQFTASQKSSVKDTFKAVLAAFLKANLIPETVLFRTVTASDNVEIDDTYVVTSGNALAVTLTLPPANSVLAGHQFVLKDGDGTADTKNLTIVRSGSNTIDGETSIVISVAYGVATLVCDGVSKWYSVG